MLGAVESHVGLGSDNVAVDKDMRGEGVLFGNAANLHAKMAEVNESGRKLVRQLPSLSMVQTWVENAKKLDPMVSY